MTRTTSEKLLLLIAAISITTALAPTSRAGMLNGHANAYSGPALFRRGAGL